MEKGYFDGKDGKWITRIKDEHGNYLDLKKGKIHYARDKLDPAKRLEFIVNGAVWGQSGAPENRSIDIEPSIAIIDENLKIEAFC